MKQPATSPVIQGLAYCCESKKWICFTQLKCLIISFFNWRRRQCWVTQLRLSSRFFRQEERVNIKQKEANRGLFKKKQQMSRQSKTEL